MSKSIVVSIGRNVNGEPMSDEDWADFRATVLDALTRDHLRPVYFTGVGDGTSEEWGPEESFTIVAGWADGWNDVVDRLGRIGRQYGQDAVAVTIGKTRFV